jgi:hypothetical protein
MAEKVTPKDIFSILTFRSVTVVDNTESQDNQSGKNNNASIILECLKTDLRFLYKLQVRITGNVPAQAVLAGLSCRIPRV